MTNYAAVPIFGGEVAASYGLQTNADPTIPLAIGSLSSFSYINVPGIDPGVQMDSIVPLGSFTRVQRNAIDYRPSAGFEVTLQDMSTLAMATRDSNGHLGSYTMLFGNSNYARLVAGMKCDSVEIDIPINGRVTAKYNMQALLVVPSATAPSAMTYSAARAFYGYMLKFTYGANTYQKLIRRVRIRINHGLVRGPVFPADISLSPYSLAGSTSWVLLSEYLKETVQTVTVTFELTNPLPIADVNQICRAITSGEILLSDMCTSGPTNLIRISFPDLSFSNQPQAEGGMQDIVSFSAEADASSFTIANT